MAENKPLRLSVEPQATPEMSLGNAAEPRPATGALLVEARTRKDMTVADAAAALRIRQAYLEAIEQGRLGDLPGATYALGFVRTYAEYLGLDGTEIVRRFKDEANELGRKTELVFPLPLSEGRFPGRIVLLVSLGLALFIYGVWHYTALRDRSMVELVPPPPITSNQPAEKPVTPSDAKPAETAPQAQGQPEATPPAEAAKPAEPAPAASPIPSATSPPAAAGAPASPATPTPAAPSVGSTSPTAPLAPNPPPVASGSAATQAPAAATPEQPAPKVFGDESADVRILLRAKAESWIQVSDEDGKVVAMRILKAGETYRVPNRDGLTLFTGNAGGLEVTVDGKIAPALGSPGGVRRDVALEPDRLLAGE